MTAACLTYAIMSGLIMQTGIIIQPVAGYLGISMTDSAAMFSYLTGGVLVGTTLSMLVYSKFAIRQVLRVAYLFFILVVSALTLLDIREQSVISLYLLAIGFCAGIGLSGGAVVISKIFTEAQRASAFITADAAFSASSFLFSTLATWIIFKNISWVYSYGAVAVVALMVAVSTLFLNYPEKALQEQSVKPSQMFKLFKNVLNVRVLLIGFALCFYTAGQATFITWSPSYLQETFGLSANEAGAAVGNYWGPAVFGLMVIAVLVSKVPARFVLIGVLSIAVVATAFLSMTDRADLFLMVTLGFGFFTVCAYKLTVSLGSQQVKNAPPVLVTFLLTCGATGTTLAPAFSAKVVENFGVSRAMVMVAILFVIVSTLVMVCLLLEQMKIQPSKNSILKVRKIL